MSEEEDQGNAIPLEQQIAAARAVYENTHGMTMEDLSEKIGVPARTLKQWKRDQKWRKKQTTRPGELADEVKELTAIMTGKAKAQERAEPSEDDVRTAEIILAPSVGDLNQILDRHRKEWTVARSMASEAVRLRDVDPLKSFERAKLAKITAETLKLIQEGERRANGMDAPDTATPVVVIDRNGK